MLLSGQHLLNDVHSCLRMSPLILGRHHECYLWLSLNEVDIPRLKCSLNISSHTGLAICIIFLINCSGISSDVRKIDIGKAKTSKLVVRMVRHHPSAIQHDLQAFVHVEGLVTPYFLCTDMFLYEYLGKSLFSKTI